ncbi:tyrosine-protein phosphatase [Salinibacterium sp. ZJ77]|uniref:tyrosine-protein phosphatase n=1 Tax=Salinibacterium sp. ZJ77 TaxID=2708337 RepID=UPI001420F7CF|nr:tyrosine-protein phosphatase [Salinibacterium sp. ZJ77]
MTDLRTSGGDAVRIPAPGLVNLRAVSGWACTGGTVRAGVLYRADSPDSLDHLGIAALRALGITAAVDLRSELETATRGYAIPGIRRHAHAISLLAPDDLHDPDIRLSVLYERLLDEHGPTLAAAVRSVAHHDGGTLVHCTAGKDRTGVVVALILLTLGVGRDDVIEDYTRTHENLVGAWTDRYLARMGVAAELAPALVEILNGSPAHVLAAALDHLDTRHGGAERYLRAHGLTDHDLSALSSRLVTPHR